MSDTPDARPAGETAEQRARTAVEDCLDYPPVQIDAALDAYRDAVATEARAALLADAPVVWVARDDDGIGWVFDTPPQKDRDGDWDVPDVHDKQWALNGMMNMPPGTCVRYRLVPDPEEAP